MAGILIAMLRVLRLKAPLQATVTSPEFKNLNLFVDLARVILNENVWVWMFMAARGVYAMMRILRLADQKPAAMGHLHYYIKQADRIAPVYLAHAEKHQAELSAETMATINETTDLASVELDNNEEDDDDAVSDDEEEDDVVSGDDDEDDNAMNVDSEDEMEEEAKEVTAFAFKQIS